MQIVPLRFLLYRYKKERSVAYKIRQNPFSAGARWGSSRRSPDLLVGWRGDTPHHTHPFGTDPPSALAMRPHQNSSQIYAYAYCHFVISQLFNQSIRQVKWRYWGREEAPRVTPSRRWSVTPLNTPLCQSHVVTKNTPEINVKRSGKNSHLIHDCDVMQQPGVFFGL